MERQSHRNQKKKEGNWQRNNKTHVQVHIGIFLSIFSLFWGKNIWWDQEENTQAAPLIFLPPPNQIPTKNTFSPLFSPQRGGANMEREG